MGETEMKKSFRRIITVALILMLLAGLGAPAFAVGSEEQPYKYYFLIGDSIAIKRGGDMPDTIGSLGFRKDTYAERIAEYFNIPQGYNGAHVGWRTQECRAAIQADYYGDVYTSDWEHRWGGDTLASIKAWQPAYNAALAKADLITINLGNNNIIGTLAYSLARVFEDQTEGTEYEKAALEAIEHAKELAPAEAIVYLLDAAKLMGQVKILIDTAIADLFEAMKQFPESWDNLIASIREVNPTADIVVVGMFNAVGNVVNKYANEYIEGIGAGLASMLQTMTNPVVDYCNSYMKCGSAYVSEYAFADVKNVDLTGSVDGSHLGRVGHEYFAKQIISAIESKFICSHENTERVNVKAATKLKLGYSGDLVCSDCGAMLEKGGVTVYHCQHENTRIVGAIKPTVFTLGYTGNLICSDCGRILALGQSVKYSK